MNVRLYGRAWRGKASQRFRSRLCKPCRSERTAAEGTLIARTQQGQVSPSSFLCHSRAFPCLAWALTWQDLPVRMCLVQRPDSCQEQSLSYSTPASSLFHGPPCPQLRASNLLPPGLLRPEPAWRRRLAGLTHPLGVPAQLEPRDSGMMNVRLPVLHLLCPHRETELCHSGLTCALWVTGHNPQAGTCRGRGQVTQSLLLLTLSFLSFFPSQESMRRVSVSVISC